MPDAVPALDHVVLDVRDRMDALAERFRALGFLLTDRGHHTLGSINHLAVFGTDYLELLGFGDDPGARTELRSFPPGLNGIVFRTADADATQAALAARGVPMRAAQSFSRPVRLDGAEQDARFRTTHAAAEAVPHGRLYFCQHFTPELVWRPEWRAHPNGARRIAALVVAGPDPDTAAAPFRRMFGDSAVQPGPDGAPRLMAGEVAIEFAGADALAARYGALRPDPAGRPGHVAVLRLGTESLAQAAQALRRGAVPGVQEAPGRLLVPAADAGNVILEFVA